MDLAEASVSELVLEIGTEEIPSRFLFSALESLKKNTESLLEANRLTYSKVSVFGTPRRMVLSVDGLLSFQPDEQVLTLGPPKHIAFDKDNRPTRAAVGFAKKEGISVESLEVEKTEKGEYIASRKKLSGEKTEKLLPEILQTLIKKIYFPKNMRFESTGVRFARPICWIAALFGGKTVEFTLAGVKSANKSFGHRFLAPAAFSFRNFDELKEKLQKNFVVLDPAKRRDIIEVSARQAARTLGGTLLVDNELLDEVTNLVEYPVVVTGGFDKSFLALPIDVLITSMKKHQKYFSVLDSKGGKLLPNFITVSNMLADNMDIIRSGNERVLRARLTDALFFFTEDKKLPLSSRLERLKTVVYQEKLGSLYDKVMRVQRLCGELIKQTGLKFNFLDPKELDILCKNTLRAASLCKCDLVSEMVVEFPVVQGAMGREYAQISGEEESVAQAIFEHYLPRFPGDIFPKTPEGLFLSIADKLDSIIGCFGINMIPTGTKDPHGLRRAGLGIVGTLVENKMHFDLKSAVVSASEGIRDRFIAACDVTVDKVNIFLKQRLEYFLSDRGFSFDMIDAVLSVASADPYDAFLRLQALDEFKKSAEFDSLAGSFKRAGNIIPEGFKGGVNPELFVHDAERRLFEDAEALLGEYGSALKNREYFFALKSVSTLKDAVDSFFDSVMVMDKDTGVKNNRLGLLYKLNEIFCGFADFSKLVNN